MGARAKSNSENSGKIDVVCSMEEWEAQADGMELGVGQKEGAASGSVEVSWAATMRDSGNGGGDEDRMRSWAEVMGPKE
ncbi:unnamed protein product [Calypogeia fissa]